MPDYVLRGAHKGADGQMGPILLEQEIVAKNPREAVRLATARDNSQDDEAVNALWLTDSAADIDRTVSQQAKQQPTDKPTEGGKPDEGIRPEDLTSESDGGAEG